VSYGYFAGLPSDGYEWFYGDGTTAGLIPTNDAQTLAFVARPAASSGHPVPPGLDGLREVLGQAWPEGRQRVDDAALVSTVRRFAGLPGYRRTAAGPGWALVGDAGYYKDPMSTHGIAQALRDAELLADAVTARLPRDVAMRRYQQVRDAVSEPVFDAVDRIASYAWDLEEVRGLLLTMNSGFSDEVALLSSLDAARLTA
jgi:2-polyprenyl-6-methoxyphenol hydroxylase-like FAD-dependent oxidoreductase